MFTLQLYPIAVLRIIPMMSVTNPLFKGRKNLVPSVEHTLRLVRSNTGLVYVEHSMLSSLWSSLKKHELTSRPESAMVIIWWKKCAKTL